MGKEKVSESLWKRSGESIAWPSLKATFDAMTLANDVAVLVFDRALAPAPLALAPASPALGAAMELIGFGRTAPDDTTPFAQRAGTATIVESSVSGIVSRGPAFTCEGDSGGPALAAGVVVGVTSSGDGACAEHSRHARIADHLAFIEHVVAATGAGSAQAGDRCWYGANCTVGECLPALDEPRLAFCTPACGGGCPGDLVCVREQCRHVAPSPGALGASCVADDDCVDRTCLAGDDDQLVCTLRCFTDLPGFACPAGTHCLAASDGGEACFVPPADRGCATAPPASLLVVLVALGQLLRGRGRP